MSESIIWFRIKSVLQFYLVKFTLTFFIRGWKFYSTILQVYLCTFYCPIYCATKLYDKNQNREKTSWYLALYKIWQCRECLVSPWGYIAENTNGWIKSEKIFLTFLDNLLFYTISLHRENGYSPRPLLCIYCIYMLCLTLITIVIYLQSLIHVHKSCTNMDIKKHAYII